MKPLTCRAFSLLELLVVIAIIGILAGLVAVSTGGMRGNQLTQAGQMITGELSLARQTATSRNRSIEVRFLRLSDPANPDPAQSSRFRAIQTFQVEESGAVKPLGKLRRLPGGVIIDSGLALSTILDPASRTARTGAHSSPAMGGDYEYFSVRFRPDGSTDLPPISGGVNQLWYLTLHGETAGDNLGAGDLPPNFWTIQIDPVTGTTRNHRP